MNWTEIITNEKMTQTTKECLEIHNNNYSLYALKYIDELEKKVKDLSLIKEKYETLKDFLETIKKISIKFSGH